MRADTYGGARSNRKQNIVHTAARKYYSEIEMKSRIDKRKCQFERKRRARQEVTEEGEARRVERNG